MNKYLGITIGPIYATLSQARKTREFWLGSYFFSHVMKLILREIQQQKYGEILAQDISTLHVDEKLHGAGIYSDRCYVRLEKEFQQADYNSLAESVLSKLIVEDKKTLRTYLQIYCTVQEISDDKNYMSILNQQLDIMELQPQYYYKSIYALVSGHSNLAKLRKDHEQIILPTNIDGLIKEWYTLGFNREEDLIRYQNNNSYIWSFPSLLEITTKGLDELNPELYNAEIRPKFGKALLEEMNNLPEETTETEILNDIRKIFREDFQTAHKYVAIITADGDNVGKLISHIAETKDDELLKSVSKNIADFAKEAAQIIHRYGGKPVYIGGDDLLFFAPVISYSKEEKKNTYIFQLIETLDRKFNDIWEQWFTDNNMTVTYKTSLSYGVSITYYKFPLNEAMDLSHDLLFNHAKRKSDDEKQKNDKNRIAIQLMMHSGSFDKVILEKHSPNDSTFYLLLKLVDNFADKKSMISSVLQRLREDTNLLLSVAKDGDSFDAYFINEYDYHNMTDTRKKAFITHSFKLFNKVFEQQKENKEKALNQLCTMYRLLNFLIHKETENGDI
jgi:CRISPR-associated protein Cmr2